MPSIVRSGLWFFRVTAPHEFLKLKINDILAWLDLEKILVATHIGDKTEKEHAHFIVTLTSQLQKQSFDTRIKSIYGVKGSDYSSKPWDGNDSACSYLFHDEKAEIIANKGYNPVDIERYRKLNDDVQKVVAVNQSRASGRHVDKVLEKIVESGSKWTQRDIFNEFIMRIRKGEMYEPGDFMLKRYVEEVYLKQLADGDIQQYASDRYFRIYNT